MIEPINFSFIKSTKSINVTKKMLMLIFWSPVENRKGAIKSPLFVHSSVRSFVRLFVTDSLGNPAYDFPDFFHDVGDK